MELGIPAEHQKRVEQSGGYLGFKNIEVAMAESSLTFSSFNVDEKELKNINVITSFINDAIIRL